MGTEQIKAKAAGVSRPIAWCANPDCPEQTSGLGTAIFEWDIFLVVGDKTYCGVCADSMTDPKECHLEEARESELTNG